MIEIIWNSLSPQDWEERFTRLPRSTLTQSYAYARALCPLLHLHGRWGLILIKGAEAGLVQLLEGRALGGLLSAVILDRGALWFKDFDTPENHRLFLQEINKQFPPRIGRRRRLLLEMEDTDENKALTATLKPNRKLPGYQTAWIDLSTAPETIRANMRRDIRQRLKQAESAGLNVEFDTDGKNVKKFLLGYAADKAQRKYPGADVKTLAALCREFSKDRKMLTAHAAKDGETVAGALFLIHGTCATYQAGWTTIKGRDSCATHLTLFESMLRLKEMGVAALDLGGIRNDGAAKGIADFKLGLGGEKVTYLSGFY